jgi:hypothetical protein
VSAAAFGRSIGLRDHGGFLAMIEAGHTPALRDRDDPFGGIRAPSKHDPRLSGGIPSQPFCT